MEGLLARTDANGSAFYHADGGGNVTALVDGQGALAARYLYDPYGNLLGEWGPLAGANRYRFSSKEWHAPSGLYDYGFRYYEPNLQRWLTRDPIGELGGINLYGFVGNDPLNYVDPYGLTWVLFDSEAWSQLLYDIFIGDGPPLQLDLNSFGALHGIDNDFGGKTGADLTKEIMMAVPRGFAEAAMLMGGIGEAERAYAAADRIYRGSKLARNCERAGKPILKGLERSHHIVAKAAKAAEPARRKLRKLGIDIDDAFNGIGLPKKFHETLHTREYYELVNAASRSWNSYDDAVNGLTEIANTLLRAAGAK